MSVLNQLLKVEDLMSLDIVQQVRLESAITGEILRDRDLRQRLTDKVEKLLPKIQSVSEGPEKG